MKMGSEWQRFASGLTGRQVSSHQESSQRSGTLLTENFPSSELSVDKTEPTPD